MARPLLLCVAAATVVSLALLISVEECGTSMPKMRIPLELVLSRGALGRRKGSSEKDATLLKSSSSRKLAAPPALPSPPLPMCSQQAKKPERPVQDFSLLCSSRRVVPSSAGLATSNELRRGTSHALSASSLAAGREELKKGKEREKGC
jgi:hypothetical protein